MNIEEAIEMLKRIYVTEFNTSSIYDNVPNVNLAIETLLTAYGKEKGENVKLRLQNIPLIEKELKAYKDGVNELKADFEKEKEKNKRLEKFIESGEYTWKQKYNETFEYFKEELEKEKEKNKELEKDILFYKRIIDEQQETIKSYEEHFAEKYNISSRKTVWKEE